MHFGPETYQWLAPVIEGSTPGLYIHTHESIHNIALFFLLIYYVYTSENMLLQPSRIIDQHAKRDVKNKFDISFDDYVSD